MKVLRYSSSRFLAFGAAMVVVSALLCPADAAAQDDEQQADEQGQPSSDSQPADGEAAAPDAAEKKSEDEQVEGEQVEDEQGQPSAGTSLRSAAEVALEAQQVHSDYCGSLQGTDRSIAGESFAVVGPMWSRVSDAYRAGGEIFLLYWSGLLSECLGRHADAVEDLQAFLDDERSKELVSMVADARSRLRRRARGQRSAARRSAVARPPVEASRVLPSLIPGIGLAAGGVVVGVVALGEQGRLEEEYGIPQVGVDEAGLKREVLDENILQLAEGQQQLRVLGSVAAGLAVSSAIAFVLGGASQRRAKKVAQSARFSVVPGLDGLHIGVISRW